MNEFKYKEFVISLCKPGQKIIKEMDFTGAHLLHMAVGVAGEAGELLDVIKKHTIYGKELDTDHLIEELGDIEFYMAGIRASLEIRRDRVLQHNMEKLTERYPKGSYTNKHANQRKDKENETQGT